MQKSMPIDYIQRTQAQYAALNYPAYRWVENSAAPPWSPLKKPLNQCKVALICSGGIYKKGQIAFHYEDDTSFRIIESDTAKDDLRITHFAYDMTAARNDPNVVFPTQGLQALAIEGAIGELAKNAYTFMGGIYSSRKVSTQLAPELASRVLKDEVDVVVLVPV
jgi:D-proline reductase (dithiol) PrdB|tara:strand:+ start:585 stop:1076 length:492 start_codon:yes stop_codon:yes gene_type:complete